MYSHFRNMHAFKFSAVQTCNICMSMCYRLRLSRPASFIISFYFSLNNRT